MQEPIIVENKEVFKKKTGLSDTELRGMKSYLDEYLLEYYYDGDPDEKIDADMFFQTAYSDSMLNCCGEATLPNAPDGLEDVPVSHFYLTEGHSLMAVFYVGDDEDEVIVRMN